MEKILGEGWELSAFRDSDRLFVSAPVSSSFVSASYDFDISEQDLSVLTESRYRQLVLGLLLHEMLQPRLLKGAGGATDEDCSAMIALVLRGASTEVEKAIDQNKSSLFIRKRLEKEGFPRVNEGV